MTALSSYIDNALAHEQNVERLQRQWQESGQSAGVERLQAASANVRREYEALRGATDTESLAVLDIAIPAGAVGLAWMSYADELAAVERAVQAFVDQRADTSNDDHLQTITGAREAYRENAIEPRVVYYSHEAPRAVAFCYLAGSFSAFLDILEPLEDDPDDG